VSTSYLMHCDWARRWKTLRQGLDTAEQPVVGRRGHQSGWPTAVGMTMMGSTTVGSAMVGSAMVGSAMLQTGTVASTAVGPTTVGPHRRVRPLGHWATKPSRISTTPDWTVSQMTIARSVDGYVCHGHHLRVLHRQRSPCAASPKDSWSGTRTTPLSPRTTARQCARAPARLTMIRSTENCSLGRGERGKGGGSSERERMLLVSKPRWLI